MPPLVFAHRGASHEQAEHTLGAYEQALAEGADGLECDVRLTADGHLVCVHDRDMRRVAGSGELVSTMELADLAELDVATWKNPWAELDDEAEQPPPEHREVLTLRRLCELVRDTGRRVELAVETKHPTRYAGAVERSLVRLLDEFGWTGPGSPVRVMSFSWQAVARMRTLAPRVARVQLVEKAHHWPFLRRLVPDDEAAGPGIEALREHPGLGRHLLEEGRDLVVWTVNTEEDVELCLRLGVSAVITDRPAYVQGLLAG